MQEKIFLVSGRVCRIVRRSGTSQVQPSIDVPIDDPISASFILPQTTFRDANLLNNDIGSPLLSAALSFIESPLSVHPN